MYDLQPTTDWWVLGTVSAECSGRTGTACTFCNLFVYLSGYEVLYHATDVPVSQGTSVFVI